MVDQLVAKAPEHELTEAAKPPAPDDEEVAATFGHVTEEFDGRTARTDGNDRLEVARPPPAPAQRSGSSRSPRPCSSSVTEKLTSAHPPSWRMYVLHPADHAAVVTAVEHEQGEMVLEVDIDDLPGERSNVDRFGPEAEPSRLG